MGIQENETGQAKPIKDAETDFKFWEFCPFCKLRRKIRREINKLIKERLSNDRET